MGQKCSGPNVKAVDAKKLHDAIVDDDRETLDVLKTVPVISSLNKPELLKFSDALKKKSFKKDDYIMKAGDFSEEFYLILSGQLGVYSAKENKQIALLNAGEYVGEQALLNKQPRNASIKCLTPVDTLVCEKKTFESILSPQTRARFAERDNERAAVLTPNWEEEDDDEKRNTLDDLKKMAWLDKCVEETLLFKGLVKEVRLSVIQQMYKETFKKGTKIITQGEAGHTFYVLESGKVQILINNEIVSTYNPNMSFGGLALLYNSPRAATVLAVEDCVVYTVTRNAYRQAVRKGQAEALKKNMEWLGEVKYFKSLTLTELSNVSEALEEKEYPKGHCLIKAGDEGDRFYLIKKGQIKWETPEGLSGTRGVGKYVGERALLERAPRAATVTCISDTVTTLELGAEDFHQLLGHIAEQMKALIKNENATITRKTVKPSQEKAQKVLGGSICDLTKLKTVGFLGKGAFGRVTLVIDPDSDKSYALKAVRKDQIVKAEQQSHIVNEKDIMMKMSNPFLVNLRKTYKDKLRVYFLLDACLGGELFTILRKKRYFDEDTSRFYTACVVEAFSYMHGNQIIYRDLKPENLVLANDGYLKVTDFGFAKKIKGKTYTLCGTPDYLAPEIVTSQGHSFGVDWWTLGVLIYEMLASFPPFYADQAINIYRNIVRCKVKYPRYLTKPAKELISAFLKAKPTKRLGVLYNGDVDKIRNHAWFTSAKFSFQELRGLQIRPPIVPVIKGNKDMRNFKKRKFQEDEAKPVPKEKDFDATF